jgi:hypothetical protein
MPERCDSQTALALDPAAALVGARPGEERAERLTKMNSIFSYLKKFR